MFHMSTDTWQVTLLSLLFSLYTTILTGITTPGRRWPCWLRSRPPCPPPPAVRSRHKRAHSGKSTLAFGPLANNRDVAVGPYLFTWCVVSHGPGRASQGKVRSGMSRSPQFWIRQLSHLAAWSIWVALWVLYMALKLGPQSFRMRLEKADPYPPKKYWSANKSDFNTDRHIFPDTHRGAAVESGSSSILTKCKAKHYFFFLKI